MKKILELGNAGCCHVRMRMKTKETILNLKATLFYDPIQEREKCRDHHDQIDQTEFFLPRIHDFISGVGRFNFFNGCD